MSAVTKWIEQVAWRKEREVGVPRRFAISMLIVLTTIYGLLFRALTALQLPISVISILALFFTGVILSQAILFHGTRPRDASVYSGAILAPLLVVLAALDSVTLGWTGWRPFAEGIGLPAAGAMMAWVVVIGGSFGYLLGALTASVFYGMRRWDHWRRGHSVADPDMSSTVSSFESRECESSFFPPIGQLLGKVNPYRPRQPWRGALVACGWGIFVTGSLACLGSPFAPWVTLLLVASFGLVAGFCSGIFQHPWWWLPLVGVCGYQAAEASIKVIQRWPYLQYYWQGPDIFLRGVRVVGVLLAVLISALIGWFLVVVGNGRNARAKRKPSWFLLAATIGLPWLTVWSLQFPISILVDTPDNLFLNSVNSKSDGMIVPGCIVLNGGHEPGTLARGISLVNPFEIAIYLRGSGANYVASLADIQALESSNCAQFHSAQPGVGRMLSGLPRLPRTLAHLELVDPLLDDATIQALVATLRRNNPPRLRLLTIHDAPLLTIDGIATIAELPLLAQLDLRGVSLRDQDLVQFRQLQSVGSLAIRDCPITNAGVRNLVAAMPQLTHLVLEDTLVTDDLFPSLQQLPLLTRLEINGDGITQDAVNQFEVARDGVAVLYRP